MQYDLIETEEQLEKIIKKINSEKYISLDTESNSLYAYYEKLCLVQIGTSKNIFLIDSLKISIEPLKDIFSNKNIRKIFHSAESDIPLLKTHNIKEINNIFDIMLAAKYLGIYRCGLNNLIEKYFKKKLNKKYQKANWGKRPIELDMLEYASMDVFYLKELKDIFIPELKNKKFYEEFLEHCNSISNIPVKTYTFNPDSYVNINGFKTLYNQNAMILKELFIQREKIAQKNNIPPFKIISNETMFLIASNPKKAIENLKNIKGITEYVFSKNSSWIIESIHKGLTSKIEVNKFKKNKNNNENNFSFDFIKQRYEKLRIFRGELAKKRNLFPELILTNDVLWKISKLKEINYETLISSNIEPHKMKLYAKDIAQYCSKKLII